MITIENLTVFARLRKIQGEYMYNIAFVSCYKISKRNHMMFPVLLEKLKFLYILKTSHRLKSLMTPDSGCLRLKAIFDS